MGKKNTKGLQKATPFMDASFEPPPYKTAFGKSNTEEVKRGKKDNYVQCKCNNKKTNNIHRRTITSESINNLYGDSDTTEGWDDKTRTFFSSKLHKQENPKEIIDQSEINDVIYSTSNLKNTHKKLSLIGVYRKRKHNRNKRKIDQYFNEKNENTDVRFSQYTEPKLKFMSKKKPEKGLKDHDDNGVQSDLICRKGPCREAIENLYTLHALKYTPNRNEKVKQSGNNNNSKKTKTPTKENKIIKNSKNKQVMLMKTTKDENVGYGDQISPDRMNKQDLKDIRRKSSFIEKIMGHTICKCKNKNESTVQTLSDVNNDNSKNEKTKTLTKENKIKKKSKNKQAKAINTAITGNFGNADKISQVPLNKQNLKDIECTCNLIGKIMRHTSKNNKGRALQTSCSGNNPTGEPLLEMKVNVEDMRVINSSEINEKIKKLGSTEKKNMSCVCHSHINGYRVCKGGPCEQALENKHTHFDCKCRRRNIIECNDSTCDLKIPDIKVKSRKKKTPKSPVCTEDNKPLFEVMLDPANMNIINSAEIQDIVIKASQNKIICPTGICNTMSKNKNTLLNCRCVGKKMTPFVNECEDRTCRKAVKKCKLSYLRSRVFSKSENWTGQEENRKGRPIRANRHRTNIKTDNYIVRSHTHNKKPGVMIYLPHIQTPKKDQQGDTKPEGDKKSVKKKTIKKDKKVTKMTKRRRRRKAFSRKKKIDDRTLTDKFLDCFDKGQEDCENKTKLYQKQEKLDIKENKEKEAEQKAFYKTNQHRWNCLTNFITGALNVSFETLKIFIKIPFLVLGQPLSSFIYVREKMKDPPAAILRVFSWFLRTWKNKSLCFARSIDESTALNVIADTIENSTIYNALIDIKGRTPEEKMIHERRKMVRLRRIQKRQDQALYSCQHILLTTMRKTPCLWFYHICPEMYPQCLNVVSFMNNFLNLLLYCGAIMCWTPCIVGFEICRGFMCCLLGAH